MVFYNFFQGQSDVALNLVEGYPFLEPPLKKGDSRKKKKRKKEILPCGFAVVIVKSYTHMYIHNIYSVGELT